MMILEKLGTIRYINIIGFGLGVIGITIIFTPQAAANSIANFLYASTGISPIIIGTAISAGGWFVLLRHIEALPYLICTLPWLFYSIGAFLFFLSNGLPITTAAAYLLIYAFIFRAGLELKP